MKLKVFSTLSSALLLFVVAGSLQAATAGYDEPKREFSKTINREFSTSAEGMTALYNRHGKVNVNTWNKNSVKIDITIIVNANNQNEADRAFDLIKVNFANSHGYVKAETVIEADNYKVCNDYQVNYEVWMPIGNQLDLKNKYGNSYVGNLNGKLMADIKYGDLRTEVIGNDVDLSLGYGKASIEKLRNLYGQISYGGLVVKEATELQFDSKYSETRIEKAKIARITSKYDDFSFGQLAELRLQTKYSDVRIENASAVFITAQYTDLALTALPDMLDADLTYGDLKIGQLGRGFKQVKILGKYTDVVLGVEPGAGYRFDFEGSYTDFHYPQSARITTKVVDGSRKTVTGYVGDSNAKGSVSARLSYGDFILK